MHFHIYVMGFLLLEHFNKGIHIMLFLSALFYLDSKAETHLTWCDVVWTCSFYYSRWEETGTSEMSFITQKTDMWEQWDKS